MKLTEDDTPGGQVAASQHPTAPRFPRNLHQFLALLESAGYDVLYRLSNRANIDTIT